jgi:hypothetical protein
MGVNLSHSFLSHSEPNFAFLRPFPPYYAATKPQKGCRIKKTAQNKSFRKRGGLADFKQQQGSRKGKRQYQKGQLPLRQNKKICCLTRRSFAVRVKVYIVV